MPPVRFFIIRKQTDHELYWSAEKEWTNNFLGAALLTAAQKQSFQLPAGGELVPYTPADFKSSSSFSTVVIPKRRTD